ncbi:NHL repeat-containing protein [Mycolicibacterium brumae]|uniref:Uncharacterized protein n=1 Tax=Mycolicibacterium brumae TaxID=85968 RepID=A0A2G5PFS4_9MYCO|nr:hypothetical protein [Mycolicibacterium brumae]PIB77169.1 hypothetical protein CQY22_002645 [Mycolicibacterium brumae]RWA15401.1 hypothetical protein MBRU_10150 [Mycolicibacterium brumae DSM 44177]UWW10514.1 hypothetical protein L2Z93_003644 [Mycolicibacterium brumae]
MASLRHRLAPLGGVAVVTASLLAGCADAPAHEPVTRASCAATLPDVWRAAFDSGARDLTPLAITPGGEVLAARDDGTLREVVQIGDNQAPTLVYAVPESDKQDAGFAAADDDWVVVGVRRNPRGANGVIPTLVRIVAINRADLQAKTIVETSAQDFADGAATIDSVALVDGTVYWFTRDAYARRQGTLRSYDLASGETADVTRGMMANLRAGGAGLVWDVRAGADEGRSAVGVATDLPDPVRDAVPDDQRAAIVTDGDSYAWPADGGIRRWSAESGEVKVTGDFPRADLLVAGPYVLAAGPDGRSSTIVDTNSGAVTTAPYPAITSGAGIVAAWLPSADKTKPAVATIVDTAGLPPLTC